MVADVERRVVLSPVWQLMIGMQAASENLGPLEQSLYNLSIGRATGRLFDSSKNTTRLAVEQVNGANFSVPAVSSLHTPKDYCRRMPDDLVAT